MAQLVRETVATASVGQDEVPLSAEIPASLPTVRGDGERLRQVLGNLIENAVKYSPAGATVRVHATPANGEVIVSVQDRGPGIASGDQQLIFEKFGRAAGRRVEAGQRARALHRPVDRRGARRRARGRRRRAREPAGADRSKPV